MELKPDKRFMERAAEKRERFESLSDEELEQEFLGRLQELQCRAQRKMFRARKDAEAMLRDPCRCPDDLQDFDDAGLLAQELADRRQPKLEDTEQLLELRRSQDLQREDLLMALIESRGPLSDDLRL
jgi:hypothetical protein